MQPYSIVLLLLAGSFLACSKPGSVRPPCDAQYVDIPQDTSYLSTPLVIPTQLIEDKLNKLIALEMRDDFEHGNKEGNDDNIKMKITRLDDIQVTWKDNVARYEAPLLILVERQIVGKKMLPTSKALALKTQFSLRIVFETTLGIGEDWRLQPHTKFAAFEWLSDAKILGGLIDVKKMVERRLYSQMPTVLEKVDQTIRTNIHLDSAIRRVWIKIQKPMVINRREKKVWVKFNPIQFELGTITTDAGNLLVQTRLSATTETLLGEDPVYTVDSTLPPLIKRQELPNNAYVHLLSEIPYTDINDLIDQKLRGKVFDYSGHRIQVKSAAVWGCGTDLVLRLRVKGDVRGDIYFSGTPQYEPDSQRIIIQNFDFEVKTQEVLLASADWLLHDSFKEKIKATLSIQLGEKIAKIPEAIMSGIERGKAGAKMDFIIEEWDFKPQKIWVRPTDIAILIVVDAKARIVLEQLGR